MNRIIASLIVGLSLATISAAGKAYVDVERLKVKVNTLFDYVKETRDDVKYIRRHFLKEDQMNEQTMAIIVALLAVSEALVFIPKIKANSIFQLAINLLKTLVGKQYTVQYVAMIWEFVKLLPVLLKIYKDLQVKAKERDIQNIDELIKEFKDEPDQSKRASIIADMFKQL